MPKHTQAPTRRLLTLLAGSFLAGNPQAQSITDPELRNPGVDDTQRRLRDADTEPAERIESEAARDTQPVRPHAPATLDSLPDSARLLPEGSHLIMAEGRLARTSLGAWVFAPTRETNPDGTAAPPVRPLILLPSRQLARLTQLYGEREPGAGVRLSGRVTLYQDQNYLRITGIGTEPTSPGPSPSTSPESPRESQPATPEGVDESTRRLIEQLEAERTGVRGVIASAGLNDAPAAIEEGRMLFRRRARLTRLDAGELALRFDNDETAGTELLRSDDAEAKTQGQAPLDAALVIAPSAALEAIEVLIERHGDGRSVLVSGETLAYAGRSYLLPTVVVLEPEPELRSRQ
ncbi:MAG: hypothetical protein AAGB48_09515 [Planctomycetota bacterium]